MKKTIFKTLLFALAAISLITACDKHVDRPNPTITFFAGQGLTAKDTVIPTGELVSVGLICQWNGTDPLKTISLYWNNEYQITYAIDSKDNQLDTFGINLYKTSKDLDEWIFELGDANGQTAYAGISLTKDKTGGLIRIHKNITLGSQTNTEKGNFYSLSDSTVYKLADAVGKQEIQDLVLGYDTDNKTYLASPAADLTGEYDLSAWLTKNSTKFCLTTMLKREFELIESDILILSAFDATKQIDIVPQLAVDKVYAFKTSTGRYGLIKINALTAAATGLVSLDIKIQK